MAVVVDSEICFVDERQATVTWPGVENGRRLLFGGNRAALRWKVHVGSVTTTFSTVVFTTADKAGPPRPKIPWACLTTN